MTLSQSQNLVGMNKSPDGFCSPPAFCGLGIGANHFDESPAILHFCRSTMYGFEGENQAQQQVLPWRTAPSSDTSVW
jgi:hypothetical protein